MQEDTYQEEGKEIRLNEKYNEITEFFVKEYQLQQEEIKWSQSSFGDVIKIRNELLDFFDSLDDALIDQTVDLFPL